MAGPDGDELQLIVIQWLLHLFIAVLYMRIFLKIDNIHKSLLKVTHSIKRVPYMVISEGAPRLRYLSHHKQTLIYTTQAMITFMINFLRGKLSKRRIVFNYVNLSKPPEMQKFNLEFKIQLLLFWKQRKSKRKEEMHPMKHPVSYLKLLVQGL